VAEPTLAGVTIVGAGSFNPAIVHPLWLAEKNLISSKAADHAMSPDNPHQILVASNLTTFVADWLSVQVTPVQAVFATVDQARDVDLRDLVRGVFSLLPETPVDALGINTDSHFQAADADHWHAFGDKFLPKEYWEPIFSGGPWKPRAAGAKERVGMREMMVEVAREDSKVPGYVRVQLAPSVRLIPDGVYILVNMHFQLTKPSQTFGTKPRRATAADAARVLLDHWDETRETEHRLLAQLQEAV
jgi:hypothetical protein